MLQLLGILLYTKQNNELKIAYEIYQELLVLI